MALLQIQPTPMTKAPHEAVVVDLRWRTFKNNALKRLIAVSDLSLDHPLPPALLFGVFMHISRMAIHYFTRGQFDGFLPGNPVGYLLWLPEFIVPYFALRFFGIAHKSSHAAMHRRILEGLERSKEIQKVSILGFAKMSEVRDPDTGDHILRMSHYSRMLAEEIGKVPEYSTYVTRQYCEEIFLSAPLHDIGKVGILDEILKKRGPLTPEEFEIMKMHTILGGDLLNELELKLGFRTFYSLGKQIAYHHHQRFDGFGYPNVLGASKAMFVGSGIGSPLVGKDIPLSARIVAIADVYDALVSKRCYKEAMPHEKAMQMIREDSGKRFDPEVLDAFFRIEKRVRQIAREFTK